MIVSGDQFGNYLIQYILTSADTHRREIVAAHVRRHMVSLRGSKYGSRVAMLCTNPAVATRPGPGSGHAAAVDRAPGGIGRGFPERGPWVASRGASYDYWPASVITTSICRLSGHREAPTANQSFL